MGRVTIGAVDSLAIFQRLKNAGLPEEAARELAMIFTEIFEPDASTYNDRERIESDTERKLEQG